MSHTQIELRITEIEEAVADDALLALSKLHDLLVRRDANSDHVSTAIDLILRTSREAIDA